MLQIIQTAKKQVGLFFHDVMKLSGHGYPDEDDALYCETFACQRAARALTDHLSLVEKSRVILSNLVDNVSFVSH